MVFFTSCLILAYPLWFSVVQESGFSYITNLKNLPFSMNYMNNITAGREIDTKWYALSMLNIEKFFLWEHNLITIFPPPSAFPRPKVECHCLNFQLYFCNWQNHFLASGLLNQNINAQPNLAVEGKLCAFETAQASSAGRSTQLQGYPWYLERKKGSITNSVEGTPFPIEIENWNLKIFGGNRENPNIL